MNGNSKRKHFLITTTQLSLEMACGVGMYAANPVLTCGECCSAPHQLGWTGMLIPNNQDEQFTDPADVRITLQAVWDRKVDIQTTTVAIPSGGNPVGFAIAPSFFTRDNMHSSVLFFEFFEPSTTNRKSPRMAIEFTLSPMPWGTFEVYQS